MAQGKADKMRNISDWLVEHLRLTVFTIGPTTEDKVEWWDELTGKRPLNIQSQPVKGASRVEGKFEGGNLILVFDPTRIDWIFSFQLEEDDDSVIRTIGPFDEVLEFFIQKTNKWIEEKCPPISRIALGAALNLPVKDRETGYKELIPYLKNVKIDPHDSLDLLYQINRPVASNSGISNLTINRLSNWSVRIFNITRVLVSPEVTKSYEEGPKQFACRLELDINTRPEFQEKFPKDKLSIVFNELAGLAKEIVAKGDI